MGRRWTGVSVEIETIETLKAKLAVNEREAAARERQLERYAADLRETFKQERQAAMDLRRSYAATVRALANAVEARDSYTGHHAERVAAYGVALGRAAGLPHADTPEIEFGFLLHDVGKVAIPDAILFKPEPLSPEEFQLMARHAVVGFEILADIDFLGDAKLVVRHHHERWDGEGYPDGLAAEAIPLAARVFAVADALDAMTTNRPYRPGGSFAEARTEIVKYSGTQFDPGVIEAYESLGDDVFAALRDGIG